MAAADERPHDDRGIDDALAPRLRRRQAELVRCVMEQLCSGQAPRYRREQRALLQQRVEALVAALCDALGEGQLVPFASFVEQLAVRRCAEGYELAEVQLALNLLQAAAWREITSSTATERQADELRRLTATVGAGKDQLARAYLREAKQPQEHVEVGALFRGTVSGPDTDD